MISTQNVWLQWREVKGENGITLWRQYNRLAVTDNNSSFHPYSIFLISLIIIVIFFDAFSSLLFIFFSVSFFPNLSLILFSFLLPLLLPIHFLILIFHLIFFTFAPLHFRHTTFFQYLNSVIIITIITVVFLLILTLLLRSINLIISHHFHYHYFYFYQ